MYKRYDVKRDKPIPANAIPCTGPDPITGHWPHWVKCDRNKSEDRYFFEAFDKEGEWEDGTYELCGPKINGNPEGFSTNRLIKHGSEDLFMSLGVKMPNGEMLYNFEHLRKVLLAEDIEGIVFRHPDGRMCKLRKSDFGIKRLKKELAI